MRVKPLCGSALLMFSVACGNVEANAPAASQQRASQVRDSQVRDSEASESVQSLHARGRRRTPIRIGVLIDGTGPAKANFTAAALLAESRLNRGLAAARSRFRVDVIAREFAAGQAVAAAIDLVNVDGVHAIVSDVSGGPNGPTGTVAVNRLNYETPSRINHKVPVTCYQCSSAFFNDPAQTDPGFADPDNWLWRTFFNATFESAVQVQLVHSRPSLGEINGDGNVKITVYYDAAHLSAATTMPGLMDQIYGTSPHSVELIQKTLPSTPASRSAELARVFDAANETTGQNDGPPDAVYLAFLPPNAPESLGDYSAFSGVTPKAPATANNGVRRDFLLPTLLANGGEGLQGSSVQVVASSRAGRSFRRAFVEETGQEPELTASFLYDAVAVEALGALKAAEGPGLTPEGIRDSIGRVNRTRGRKVRATPSGFARAAKLIERDRRINVDGAASSLDLTAAGEMYPNLVHWTIQGGKFVESEAYRCDPQNPVCTVVP
jgi:hypothetical protein